MSTQDKLREALRMASHAIPNGLPGSFYATARAAVDEALAALAAAQQAEPWQPIETAPRGSGEDGPSSTRHPDYIEPPKILLWTEEGPVVGYYDWYYHPGYGRGAEPGVSAWRDNSGGQAYGPTHWMPLPPAPGTPPFREGRQAVALTEEQIADLWNEYMVWGRRPAKWDDFLAALREAQRLVWAANNLREPT